MELFPTLPEDLSSLTADELAAAIADRRAIVARIKDGDEEIEAAFPDMQALLDTLKVGVEQIKNLDAESTRRESASAEAEAELQALLEAAGTDDAKDEATDEPEDEAKTDEPDAEPEPDASDDEPASADVDEKEPVLAASQKRFAGVSRRRSQDPADRDEEKRGRAIALADIPGFANGQRLKSPADLATAFSRRLDEVRGLDHAGGEQKLHVARFIGEYPESRKLVGDLDKDHKTIENLVGDNALVASGGVCAPATPFYDLMLVADDARPVRDSLPSFNAVRGGIRFAAPPVLSAITTAVGRKTMAEDAAGGTTATKTCQTITCPSITQVDIAAIYHCVKFGNMGARAWPEQVEQFLGLVMAAQARVAETALLDGMNTASTAVTGSQVGGANNTLLPQILVAAAGMRSRHRMRPEVRLRVYLPAWSVEMLVADLIRSQFQRFDQNQAGVVALMRSFGIEPTFFVDGVTGAGQVFGAQGAGALLGFPTTVVWFIFPEGSFLFLDGGELDLGIVRDSTLNATNDFQIFGETFANGEVTLPRTQSCPIV
jgi:hypothetical protein